MSSDAPYWRPASRAQYGLSNLWSRSPFLANFRLADNLEAITETDRPRSIFRVDILISLSGTGHNFVDCVVESASGDGHECPEW